MRLKAENLKIGDIFYRPYGFTAIEKYWVDNVDDGEIKVSVRDKNGKTFVCERPFGILTCDMDNIFSTESEAWEHTFEELRKYTKAATENYKKRKMEMAIENGSEK